MATTTLSKKYQIVIPRDVRKRMGLSVGEAVTVHSLDDGRAILVKHSADPVQALKGLGKGVWKNLGGTRAYIKRERAAWR